MWTHTLTCISRGDALSVRPVYKERNLASRHLDVISFPPGAERKNWRDRKRERVARRSGQFLSPLFESLGFTTWNRSREAAAENNSIPELFGNVAIDTEISIREAGSIGSE